MVVLGEGKLFDWRSIKAILASGLDFQVFTSLGILKPSDKACARGGYIATRGTDLPSNFGRRDTDVKVVRNSLDRNGQIDESRDANDRRLEGASKRKIC